MDGAARDLLEGRIRARFDAGDLVGACTVAVEGYGPEIFGYLVGVLHAPADADEVFGDLCACVWTELPRFRWECTWRTWAYTLARHRIYAFRAGQPRVTPLSQAPEVLELAARARTTTEPHRRTEVKTAIQRLREQLDDDERMLLILRVDRELSWAEVARVMELSEPALRKRFERVKTRLRELARASS